MPSEILSPPAAGEGGLRSDYSIEDVVKQINLCIEKDEEIRANLDTLLEERKRLERQVERVMYPKEAHSFKQNMDSLSSKIQQTSIVAFTLSSKVRRFDTAQAHLEEVIKSVEDIVTLKSTIDKVNVLVEKKDYETAAKMTHAILHAEDKSIGDQQTDPSMQVLMELERKLVNLVIKDCDRAAVKAAESAKKKFNKLPAGGAKSSDAHAELGLNDDDEQDHKNAKTDGEQSGSISREFRTVFDLCLTLPLLGKPHQGLGRYCFAARTMLVLGSKSLHLGSLATIKYPDRLSEMLDAIAYCIQMHTKPLRDRFGPGSELRLIQELLEECDSKIHLLVKSFIDSKKIAKIVSGVRKVMRQMAPRDRNNECKSPRESGKYDPKVLDAMLEEIAYICREIQIFDFNIRQVGDSARSELKSSPSQAYLHKCMCEDRLKDTLPRTTKVNQLQQELTGQYIAIEEYFMSQDVQTAISLDDNSDHNQTTSMVDDVFYILKKCSERAFSTCDINSACAIVNLLNNMLITLYKDQLSSKIEECWEKTGKLSNLLSFGSSVSGDVDSLLVDGSHGNIITALNNMDVSAQHTITLRSHLVGLAGQVFRHMPSAVKMANQCLEGLNDTATDYNKLVKDNVNKFVVTQVEKVNGPQALGSLLEQFGLQSYELKEADYSNRQANDTYIPGLLQALQMQHKSMAGKMTQNNLDLMLHALASHVTKRIESSAMRKRFTFWGGLQFDKDVRKVSSLFTNLVCTNPIREKFARIMQMASVLQVDCVEEVLDYWTSDSQVWRLSPREVKMVLGLRLEFKKPQIQKLKLT